MRVVNQVLHGSGGEEAAAVEGHDGSLVRSDPDMATRRCVAEDFTPTDRGRQFLGVSG
ncbi:MAG: hypothetical protein AVDCRST_MAG29-1471 [uncultured Nocardioidaceae bacterium]|uniref:Uncharacterized protein n=1 Tax=uncultured Nocardioidaceae bacterium TaxID=253824 RepID=A0A6J4LSJ1_9ACTN|nr:MAG: hypothetical protein AVDCRST_MAG29-1471 [uncultured Nocardioidaceae bacterium]